MQHKQQCRPPARQAPPARPHLVFQAPILPREVYEKYERPPSPTANFSSKLFSQLKQLTRSPHRSRAKKDSTPGRATVQGVPIEFFQPLPSPVPSLGNMSASSSASSNLTSVFDRNSPTASYSSPDSSPEAPKRVLYRPDRPQRPSIPSPPIIVERAATPEPRLAAPLTSDQTPYSPPFDPAFEQAAASSMLAEDSPKQSQAFAPTPDPVLTVPKPLASSRLPSMRFDDLTSFISDLESRLCEANGRNSIYLKQQRALPAMTAEELAVHKPRRDSLKPKNRRSVASNGQRSSLPYASSSSSIASLTVDAPLRIKKRSKRVSIKPIAIPDRAPDGLEMIESPSPRTGEFKVFSPRMSSLPEGSSRLSLLDSALPAPAPPVFNIQPPTPVIASEEFAAPSPKLPRKQYRLKSIHRIPAAGVKAESLSSESQSSPTRSESVSSAKESVGTPPLSPSSTDTSLTPSDTCPTLSDEEEDGEQQLFNMLESLKRPYSSIFDGLNKKAENPSPEESGYQLLPASTESGPMYHLLPSTEDGSFEFDEQALVSKLTNANLRIHTDSALSNLQQNARQSLKQFVSTPHDDGEQDYTPTDTSSHDYFGRFDDAPDMQQNNDSRQTTLVTTPPEIGRSSLDRARPLEGDLGLAVVLPSTPKQPMIRIIDTTLSPASSIGVLSDSSDDIGLGYSPRRERRRKAGESLFDLDGAVVHMAERVEIGVAF